jgi:hypothetical protein
MSVAWTLHFILLMTLTKRVICAPRQLSVDAAVLRLLSLSETGQVRRECRCNFLSSHPFDPKELAGRVDLQEHVAAIRRQPEINCAILQPEAAH